MEWRRSRRSSGHGGVFVTHLPGMFSERIATPNPVAATTGAVATVWHFFAVMTQETYVLLLCSGVDHFMRASAFQG